MTSSGAGIGALSETSSPRADQFLELVAPKLQLVEEELRLNFQSKIKTLSDVGDHILGGGGKRLRPALLLLVSQMLRYEGTKDVLYAAIVEFIHTATLVHDDVIDEAAIRRGRSSVNYRWGNHLTVLVGDYLYAHSMNSGLLEGNLDVLRLLSGTTIRMIEGEIIALEQNGRADISVDEYFDVVGRKTAALFGASCRIPAILAGTRPELAEALYEYGFNLGICFQLIDDLLDFTSSTEVLGKPALSDLKDGKLTLPLILALPSASDEDRALVERVALEHSFGAVPPPELIAIAEKYDSIAQTREIARDYAARARQSLEPFPPSEARDALAYALEFVVTRAK